ncbi:MarR family transcriptional regulator [Rhodopirellula sp. JC740]|uniref:MarR family transcriptional regulator n=1 Tax=Rhodopirellula halodulae TaxID=2894198 RepID=A0ABS8NRW3_9BACT|nr:MarR family transcriptional regulator [Rhodopirellula sp. JC740]MCC9645206.1 MarR family transcriptional regulator [Rhodopirellula sp. JC740]
MLDPETDLRNLPLALRSAYLALHRQTDAVLSPLGLTADQFVLMLALTEDETLTQKELADRISSDPSTIRAMLVLLEKKGMILRKKHPKDLRAKAVSLSAAGRKKAKQAWLASQPIRDQMNESLRQKQASILIECLDTLAGSLGSTDKQTFECKNTEQATN